MKTSDMYIDGGAVLSPCRIWRYALRRDLVLRVNQSRVNFVCLNPSTADEDTDDCTVRRCIRFAKTWGYERCVVTNLFAFRATKPEALLKAADPVGPENDDWLLRIATTSQMVVVAWGVHGQYLQRGQRVLEMLADARVGLWCLGITNAGFPRHPLYLRNDTRPVPWQYVGDQM